MKRIGFVIIISFILVSVITIITTIYMSKDFTFEEEDDENEVENNQINLSQNIMKKKIIQKRVRILEHRPRCPAVYLKTSQLLLSPSRRALSFFSQCHRQAILEYFQR